MRDMKIVDPSADDLTIQQAAAIACCNAKTLRRAVQAGQLPRHYRMSRHGLQLVFRQGEVEQWMARREPVRHTARQPADHGLEYEDTWAALPALLARLQARLGESHEAIAQLSARIEDQDRLIERAQATITALSQSLQQRDAASAPAAPAQDAPHKPDAHTGTDPKHGAWHTPHPA